MIEFKPTEIEGLWVVESKPAEDDRGFFARTYCEQLFDEHGLNTFWPQQNLTLTRRKWAIRGMHYQAEPKPEIKLVRCMAGRVLDVLVDVRRNSSTFGRWQAFELSEDNHRAMYVPTGIAHGFQCLTENCQLFYNMSESYIPDLARGLRWDDPDVGIRWPSRDAMLSGRDLNLPFLKELD